MVQHFDTFYKRRITNASLKMNNKSYTPWSSVVPENVIVTQLVNKFLPFMELDSSYHVHRSLPLEPVLIQMNPVHPVF
jgi:hypothetical protein